MNQKIITCPNCNGEGSIMVEIIAGYVSREMAMDACDMAYENQPIYETVEEVCPYCGGRGEVEESEVIKDKISDDELPT